MLPFHHIPIPTSSPFAQCCRLPSIQPSPWPRRHQKCSAPLAGATAALWGSSWENEGNALVGWTGHSLDWREKHIYLSALRPRQFVCVSVALKGTRQLHRFFRISVLFAVLPECPQATTICWGRSITTSCRFHLRRSRNPQQDRLNRRPSLYHQRTTFLFNSGGRTSSTYFIFLRALRCCHLPILCCWATITTSPFPFIAPTNGGGCSKWARAKSFC